MFLKQSTSTTIILGPFVDSTDGVTAETGLTISQSDVRLSKNAGTYAQKNDTGSCTHMENGNYSCALNTTDTNTLGRLRVSVAESGALPVWVDFLVLPANVYDSLLSTDKLQVHAVEIDNGLIADAVWDEALSGHLTAGSTGEALNDSGGAASDPWNTALPGSYTAGKAGYILGTNLDQKISLINQSPGAGAITFTYTLTNSNGGAAISGADVWATSDAAGNTVVASGTTDGAGQVTFYLDAGTYYIWRQKAGWNFTNPDTETVS